MRDRYARVSTQRPPCAGMMHPPSASCEHGRPQPPAPPHLLLVNIAESHHTLAEARLQRLEKVAPVAAGAPDGEVRPVLQDSDLDCRDAMVEESLPRDGVGGGRGVVAILDEYDVHSMQAAAAKHVGLEEEQVLALLLAEAAAGLEGGARHEPSRHEERTLAEAMQDKLGLAHAVRPANVARGGPFRLPANLAADQTPRAPAARGELALKALWQAEVIHILKAQPLTARLCDGPILGVTTAPCRRCAAAEGDQPATLTQVGRPPGEQAVPALIS